MTARPGWDHSEEWIASGKTFAVSVARYERRGQYVWWVLGRLTPDHPLYEAVGEEDVDEPGDALKSFTFGPSRETPDTCTEMATLPGETARIEVGHFYEAPPYCLWATREEAATIFADADRLFAVLALHELRARQM